MLIRVKQIVRYLFLCLKNEDLYQRSYDLSVSSFACAQLQKAFCQG